MINPITHHLDGTPASLLTIATTVRDLTNEPDVLSLDTMLDLNASRLEYLAGVVQTAVDDLLRVHATTGIDLTCWEPVLPLITLVYPSIVLEGTGETTEHQVASPAGETGRYWLDGDTSKPCNEDAWGAYPTQFSPNLGRIR